MADQLPELFRQRLATLCPKWPNSRFLVAYSGGLDSSALIHLAALILPRGQLGAAHLNHSLRGEDSARDQRFAETTARELGLPFLTESRNVAELALDRRKGLEEAARRARYEFLKKAANDFQADFVLTAHQADDQAETLMLNLVKGAGPGGLAGIPPRRPLERPELTRAPQSRPVEVLRPLLYFTRSQLQTWLIINNLSWAEDLSNQDPRYRRNLMRRDILPALRNLNPRLVQALTRTAEVIRGEEDFWALHLQNLWPRVVIAETPKTFLLNRQALRSLTLAEQRRLIYEALTRIWAARPNPPEPLTFAGVEMVLAQLKATRHGGLDLPGGLRFEVKRDELRLSLASRLAKQVDRNKIAL